MKEIVGRDRAASWRSLAIEIIEKLGKGSMGIVLQRAARSAVDRIVAVKILLDALAQNKEFIKRFDREAKIAAKLSAQQHRQCHRRRRSQRQSLTS